MVLKGSRFNDQNASVSTENGIAPENFTLRELVALSAMPVERSIKSPAA
jgi:hypothetical protein